MDDSKQNTVRVVMFVAITSMYWCRSFKNEAVVGILMERICPSCCAVAKLELILTLMQGGIKSHRHFQASLPLLMHSLRM